MFRQRLRAYSDTVDWNVAIAFWLFGMLSQLPSKTVVSRIPSNTWRHGQLLQQDQSLTFFRPDQQHPLCRPPHSCLGSGGP